MLEKHFTLDKNLPGPDHLFSADPAEFRVLVSAIRTLESSLGRSVVGPTPSEWKSRRDFRLSCVASRDMSAGHRLRMADVAFRRPGYGLPPQSVDWLVGRRLAGNVRKGAVFSPKSFS
jgi:N-acetylneuraminate synthase/N,N'-diacetyllegionaminate synthase